MIYAKQRLNRAHVAYMSGMLGNADEVARVAGARRRVARAAMALVFVAVYGLVLLCLGRW